MKRVILILIAILTLTGAVSAQKRSEKEKREEQERQELEKKKLALLNEVVSASWGLKAPENRLFVMAHAADLLWDYDQKRARTLYWDALNSLNLTSASRSAGENPSKAEQQKLREEYLSTFEVRQKMLRQVARRDAQLALDMLRATRQVQPPKSEKGMQVPDDRDLEQEIATEVIARDPAQALQLARESLAKGLSYEVLNLLFLLNRKDSEKASQFAGEIITKLRAANLATDIRASSIAYELVRSSRPLGGARLMNAALMAGPQILALTDEQKRELVDSLTNAALTISANSSLLYGIRQITVEIDQFFPERRVALEKKLVAFSQTLNQEQREGNDFDTLIREGRAEDLVRKALSPEGSGARPIWFGQAVLIAVGRRETDSFREFVAKEIKDDGERQKVFDDLDSREIDHAVYTKQLDDLQKLLPKIRRKEERARATAELAMMLKEKGDDQAASSLLDDAATLIKTDLMSESQSNALLALLCAYAVVDPPKAFAIAERTIDQANNQLSALLLLDRVFKSGMLKKGEIRLERTLALPPDYLLFKYGKGLVALAKADFGRTRALAERFDRNELRVMARLLIVKSLKQPERDAVSQ